MPQIDVEGRDLFSLRTELTQREREKYGKSGVFGEGFVDQEEPTTKIFNFLEYCQVQYCRWNILPVSPKKMPGRFSSRNCEVNR
jgi:hypothetical protein